MTDDRYEERRDRPSWSAVPTMPWTRVHPGERPPSGEPERDLDRDRERHPERDRDLEPERETERDYRARRPTSDHPYERGLTSPAVGTASAGAAATGSPPPDSPPPGSPALRAAAQGTGQGTTAHGTTAAHGATPHGPTAPGATGSGSADPPADPNVDPEGALAAARIAIDPLTLHEQADSYYELTRIRDALTAKIDKSEDNPSRARLLGIRSVVSRILGDLGPAHSDAKMALVHAEATGQLRRIAVAQARLANVLVRLGEMEEAAQLFARANSPELPERLRATMHHFAGKCSFEQDRYIEACQHFEKALELRRDGDPELVAATEVALDALFSRVAERGWGPYPRSRDELLAAHVPPVPTFEQRYDRWGYANPDGSWPIGPQFADVQPFRDGVAWVRPVGIETWGLIDEAGQLLIDPRSGYLGVGIFSDGLAWVSRDGQGGWFAIDKGNRVVIQSAFDDVRPFRRGLAIARQRGRWGAVERSGRLAVQFAFDSFATGLADGRYVDGFTDEGLAVVELKGRKGVIDRNGRVLVPIAHPTILIHPVAFLFTDANHRWGAFSRNGQPLVDPRHPSRKSVTDEIEHLLSDSRPLL